ncbi:DeoR/GlpR family DNA-binding transcription regulator [Nocardioides sp. Arc9.136]|uniref:DeoR/GlpR family DNA-binding transcription regulator n=1 Tax=Nocardioides sp. Arc9.136 TaxID=2996826 RepID=UPI002665F339|nr:DeoR/GlpR family DNA-binding transcription regulator [Nocardioides sp. Arc9.136]WKN48870.1 DeoR/GlpR family DNA-binding transcription regulator [Nocardioides sp. Arc9.136]
MRVFASERQARVLQELHRRGKVEVTGLSALLGVSEDTVRRDLRTLAEAGHLQKTHGGAVALDPARMPFRTRADVAGAAKTAIATVAARLVEPGQTLFLDAGSSVLALAAALEVRPLQVVTNSLDVAALLEADEQVTLVLAGGRWDPHSRFFAGPTAVATLAAHRADWAFLGACALHPGVGATSVDPLDAEMKQTMAGAALRTVVLADATKHGSVAPHAVLGTDAIDVLVTEEVGDLEPWRLRGVDVLVAGGAG